MWQELNTISQGSRDSVIIKVSEFVGGKFNNA